MVANLETIGPDIESQPLNNNFASLNSAKMEKTADSDLDMNARSIRNLLTLHLRNATPLTISNGAITVTQTYHSVDTEGGAPTDDLDTINGGNVGDILILRGVSGARKVTVRHGVGNIYTWDGQNITLESGNLNFVQLVKMSATQWVVVGVGNPGIKRTGDTMTGDLSMGYTENGERRLVWETPGSNVYWYYHHSSSRNDFGIYDSGLLQSPFVYDRLTSIVKLFNNFEIYNDGSVLNRFYVGVGSPEGNITAPPGAIYQDKGSPGGLYIKDTGTGNMGWKKVQTA